MSISSASVASSSRTKRSHRSAYSKFSQYSEHSDGNGGVAAQTRYFEEARFNCAEIIPDIDRARFDSQKDRIDRKWEMIRKLMKHAKIDDVDENIELLKDFDKSETWKMHGNVSTNTYESILRTRGFDIYGYVRRRFYNNNKIIDTLILNY